MKLAELPPLSLYIHIPWCLKKCPYCDFNSHEKREELPEIEYVDAVVADLEATLPKVWGRRLHTIFIGGGTPSLFSPRAIDRLLTAVRTRIGPSSSGSQSRFNSAAGGRPSSCVRFRWNQRRIPASL